MEKGDAVPVRDSREEDAARTRRLALALLLRLAAALFAVNRIILLGFRRQMWYAISRKQKRMKKCGYTL